MGDFAGTMMAPTDEEKGTKTRSCPALRWRETQSQSLTITSTSPACSATLVASSPANATISTLMPSAASSP